MRYVKTLTLADRAIQIRELTVADIRAWLKDLETDTGGDVVDVALFEDVRLADLALLTDLAPEAVEALTPSQLRQVFDAAREVNADFFGMRGRLMRLGQAALAGQDAS